MPHRACVSNRRISFAVKLHYVAHAPRRVYEVDSAPSVLPNQTDVYVVVKGVLNLVAFVFKELLGRISNLLDGQRLVLAKKDTHARRRGLKWRWGVGGYLRVGARHSRGTESKQNCKQSGAHHVCSSEAEVVELRHLAQADRLINDGEQRLLTMRDAIARSIALRTNTDEVSVTLTDADDRRQPALLLSAELHR